MAVPNHSGRFRSRSPNQTATRRLTQDPWRTSSSVLLQKPGRGRRVELASATAYDPDGDTQELQAGACFHQPSPPPPLRKSSREAQIRRQALWVGGSQGTDRILMGPCKVAAAKSLHWRLQTPDNTHPGEPRPPPAGCRGQPPPSGPPSAGLSPYPSGALQDGGTDH